MKGAELEEHYYIACFLDTARKFDQALDRAYEYIASSDYSSLLFDTCEMLKVDYYDICT